MKSSNYDQEFMVMIVHPVTEGSSRKTIGNGKQYWTAF